MEKYIQDFLSVTNTDSNEVALYYLTVSDGDLQTAICSYFEDLNDEGCASSSSSNIGVMPSSENHNKDLVLLEWNIQGLLDDCLQLRTAAVISEIQGLKPDIVLLQEVTAVTLMLIKVSLENHYDIVDSRDGNVVLYFTAILSKKTTIKVNLSRTISFSNSMQGRNVLLVEVTFKQKRAVFITSHLESMKPQAKIRIEQLKQVANLMCSFDRSISVIFGGDTNLSASDYRAACSSNKLKNDVVDVWECLGCKEDCRYTWDLQTNDNQIKGGQARCRYERVYMRKVDPYDEAPLKPSAMQLVGTKRLSCGMFPSDHWGILTTFSY